VNLWQAWSNVTRLLDVARRLAKLRRGVRMTITVSPHTTPLSLDALEPHPLAVEPDGLNEADEAADEAEDEALARLAEMDRADPARIRLREQIIYHCMQMARREAGRYRHAGESMDDLVQVATVGLIHAVDRFDITRGVPFRHFAVPTIAGELKKHFRDKGWSVRVSRRVQELHQEVSRAEPELAQRLCRTPTVADLANHLKLSERDVLAARGGAAAYKARSLNWRVQDDDDAAELGDLLGIEDRDLEGIADREALRQALLTLPQRLRFLLSLRFVENLTQAQIAGRVGVSQMHVSRLINRALCILRGHMLAERPLCIAPVGRARRRDPAGRRG
jgi:RNA polymerase sigma-B factor